MNRFTQTICVLAVLLISSSAPAQTSDSGDFAEFGKLLVGRWASQITLISDWSELSKKQGDVVNGYTTLEWKADKNAIMEEELIADGTMTALYFLDLDSKTIKGILVSSAGRTTPVTYWKDGAIWRWKVESGVLPDGKKLTGNGTIAFQDDGATMIREGKVFLDGKELPPYRDIYKRVSKD